MKYLIFDNDDSSRSSLLEIAELAKNTVYTVLSNKSVPRGFK